MRKPASLRRRAARLLRSAGVIGVRFAGVFLTLVFALVLAPASLFGFFGAALRPAEGLAGVLDLAAVFAFLAAVFFLAGAFFFFLGPLLEEAGFLEAPLLAEASGQVAETQTTIRSVGRLSRQLQGIPVTHHRGIDLA